MAKETPARSGSKPLGDQILEVFADDFPAAEKKEIGEEFTITVRVVKESEGFDRWRTPEERRRKRITLRLVDTNFAMEGIGY